MKQPWAKFLTLTFLLTYLCHGGLAILNARGVLELNSLWGQALYILGGSSPTIIAFVVVHVYYAEDEKKAFYRKLLNFKQPIPYYLFAIMMPIGLGLMFFLTAYLLGTPLFDQVSTPFQFFLLFVPAIIFGGLEEVGWRGILQDQLEARFGSLRLAILIGLIWGLWHLPMFLIPDLGNTPAGLLPFALQGVVFSLFMTWLYQKTASIPLVVFFHAAINAAGGIGLRIPFENQPAVYLYLVIAFVLGVLLLRAGREM